MKRVIIGDFCILNIRILMTLPTEESYNMLKIIMQTQCEALKDNIVITKSIYIGNINICIILNNINMKYIWLFMCFC